MDKLRVPVSTYRLQFNAQFRFEHARALVEYLHQLGITDIYSSPLLQARRGSTHGYDVTNPTHLNSEIGSEQDFEELAARLKEHSMGLLLDIVPNHMASGSENPWWMDVLEEGSGSAYASFFDIDWHPPRVMLRNKVLLPILGRPYAQALENQELKLGFDQGGFFIQCFDAKLPVAPKTSLQILQYRLDDLQRHLGAEHAAFRELGGICVAAANLPERVALSVEMAGERRMQREAIKERLATLYHNSPEVRAFIDDNVRLFNGRKRSSNSFTLLDRLMARQPYLLCYAFSPNDEINYRRFFTINNLVGVRIEDPLVFEATHSLVLRLIERGLVTGLRIDHVDGLRDPHGYLRRLQERATGTTLNGGHPPFYVIVEKILARGERLPAEWPVCGATGYAAINAINGLFLDPDGCRKIQQNYQSFTGATLSFADLVYEKKKEVMTNLLGVEMRTLGHYLALLAEQDRYARDLPRTVLTSALTEVTACLPIYRTYVRSFSPTAAERDYLEQAMAAARQRNPGLAKDCFDFVSDVLQLREKPHVTPEQREARLAFIMRWQQFTGPIMAKGFEDSALYVYHPLISLNEVGGCPDSKGVSVAEFHAFCQGRCHHGHTLNATSTHDTKRAEDVRARINVLSEIPDAWSAHLERWAAWNKGHKSNIAGVAVPDANEEILIYQTMLGAWPLDPHCVPAFRKRLQDYMLKALREAMVHTGWADPNLRYERAVLRFVKSVTNSRGENPFLAEFLELHQQVSYYGAINSLSQVLLKITMPGVPDFYQGSELWDFRLVDPDNRGPVDFGKRLQLHADLQQKEKQMGLLPLVGELLRHWQDGAIKLFVASKALNFRKAHVQLFIDGGYHPLDVGGAGKEHVFAFLRHTEGAWALAAIPRLAVKLGVPGQPPLGEHAWHASTLHLPKFAPTEWVNVLTGETLCVDAAKSGRVLPLAGVFKHCPVALLASAAPLSS